MTFSRFTLFVAAMASCVLSANSFGQQFNGQQQTPAQQQQNMRGQGNAGAANQFGQQQQATAPQRPFAELDENHQRLLDRILDIWQQSSGQVRQYTCDFRRWDYDPTYCNHRNSQDNRLSAYQISDGIVRFGNPDKGMFETTIVRDFNKKDTGEIEYVERTDKQQNHEKWICDGRGIYEFDFKNKILYEMNIPPEMQGKGLANSPLPFLFGVEKQVIKERYWIRVITPRQVEKTEVWLEAYPKNMDDARNYRKLEIILAQEDFLPKMLHIYAPNYDAKTNPISRVFEFGNRQVNSQLDKIKNFMGVFVRPQVGFGWKRVNRQALANQKSMPPVNVGQNPQGQLNQGQPRR